MSNAEFKQEAKKEAIKHAWDFFTIHATQRMQSVNFFLVAEAFLFAAFVNAINENRNAVGMGIAVLGTTICYLFYRFERRIRSLIHAAEDALKPLERNLAEQSGVDSLEIFRSVDQPKPGAWAYSKVFFYLYAISGIVFALGFLYACWAAIQTKALGNGAFYACLEATIGVFLIFACYEMLTHRHREIGQKAADITVPWIFIVVGSLSGLSGVVILIRLVLYDISRAINVP